MRRKIKITVYKNGVKVGYIRSVSYMRQKYFTTPDKSKAKSYDSEDYVMGEIDFLTRLGFMDGFVFGYED